MILFFGETNSYRIRYNRFDLSTAMHIAIIMDGNGRWAIRRGLPRYEGHRTGAVRVREITEECARRGIEQLTLYCLSSENWKRPKAELDFLMQLLKEYIVDERPALMKHNVRLSIIGERDGIPGEVLAEIDKSVAMTLKNTGIRLCLAVNYGSRGEITNAVRKIVSGQIPAGKIDEQCISQHLYTAGMSDPDLLIRTAGELRLSNYLLWQLSYAEIWVTEKCWPDFNVPLLEQALGDFTKRTRKFGGLTDIAEQRTADAGASG
ncbi:MAG: di-trans,poly-cis-decaprenylcistransferase [Planctomycetaceae bacterium]|jgi:undecaprenyl diphosphate synthase|nr:di-trans,poly-cis-decaprenylcistransferase [Planctomycetaceae bacterium]